MQLLWDTHRPVRAYSSSIATEPERTDNVESLIQKARAAEPEAFAWLDAHAGNEFADSLVRYATKKGYLSDGQLNAVLRSIERDKQRAEAEKNAPNVDTTRLEAVFQVAAGNGLKKPALTIGPFHFSPAPATGHNPGAIYVKQEGVYLGKMLRGQFLARLTGEFVGEVLKIAGDPEGEAIKHGKLTGRCAVCSRKLSDPESTARGIGPVCASRYGW